MSPSLAAKILIRERGMLDDSLRPHRLIELRLPEKRIQLPERILLPFIKWMVVALRALHR